MVKLNLDNLQLTFYDCRQQIISTRKLTSVPLLDKAIRELSIEYYSDPEPCIIHRSAIMNRMFVELYEFFDHLRQSSGTRCRLADLPPQLLFYFESPSFDSIVFMFHE